MPPHDRWNGRPTSRRLTDIYAGAVAPRVLTMVIDTSYVAKLAASSCLLAALGLGIALPLIWSDASEPTGRRFRLLRSRRDFPAALWDDLTRSRVPPLARRPSTARSPTSTGTPTQAMTSRSMRMSCPRETESCVYRLNLALAYLRSCREPPPAIVVHCDQAADRCSFRVGNSRGSIRYNDEPQGIYC
jgi:hypothetical protein